MSKISQIHALVIGGGPAGLMAAETLIDGGLSVTLVDAKPSFGRKLLMAGKSGLNLTMDEPIGPFLSAYGVSEPWLSPMIQTFGPTQMQAFSNALGQPVFTGSSGRVFPVAKKASPLLRAWLARLANKGVQFQTRWHWQGWQGEQAVFETAEGVQITPYDVMILALGGASWPRLGSDGGWAGVLTREGVDLAPFLPSNMGFDVNWSPYMEPHFGAPVKPVIAAVGTHKIRGEFVLTKSGIEGGAIYAISQYLREPGAELRLDLFPDVDAETLRLRLSKPRGKASWRNHLRKSIKLTGVKAAVVNEFAREVKKPQELARLLKAFPIPVTGARPISEAISTAGGVKQSSLDQNLMLNARPGVFCVGEMLDWDAPTGGYLITACMATGLWAGKAASGYASSTPHRDS